MWGKIEKKESKTPPFFAGLASGDLDDPPHHKIGSTRLVLRSRIPNFVGGIQPGYTGICRHGERAKTAAARPLFAFSRNPANGRYVIYIYFNSNLSEGPILPRRAHTARVFVPAQVLGAKSVLATRIQKESDLTSPLLWFFTIYTYGR